MSRDGQWRIPRRSVLRRRRCSLCAGRNQAVGAVGVAEADAGGTGLNVRENEEADERLHLSTFCDGFGHAGIGAGAVPTASPSSPSAPLPHCTQRRCTVASASRWWAGKSSCRRTEGNRRRVLMDGRTGRRTPSTQNYTCGRSSSWRRGGDGRTTRRRGRRRPPNIDEWRERARSRASAEGEMVGPSLRP